MRDDRFEYFVDDTPIDFSKYNYSDEEIKRMFKERFGEYAKDNESEE